MSIQLSYKHLAQPIIPYEKMKTIKGNVQSILRHHKSSDILTLKTSEGEKKLFGKFYKVSSELLNKDIKIWYSSQFRDFQFQDYIHYIEINKKAFKRKRSYQERKLERNFRWLAIKDFLIVAIISILILWIGNRKELPIHRLNRLKRYKFKMKKNQH